MATLAFMFTHPAVEDIGINVMAYGQRSQRYATSQILRHQFCFELRTVTPAPANLLGIVLCHYKHPLIISWVLSLAYFDAAEKMPSPDAYDKMNLGESYLLEAGLKQHPAINAINPSCINTLRLVTVHEEGEIIIAAGFFRLGVGDTHVDNASSGGIFVPYHVEHNMLAREAYRLLWHGGETFLRHPDTGHQFEGIQLPYPEKVRELVVQAAQLFPKQKIIGWDIAFTPDGPVIVEANANPSAVMNQIAEKGLKSNETYKRLYAHLI